MDIGIDLTEISRIEKLYTKDKFKNRVFNASEVEYIESKKNWAQTAAGIFAAKEAFSKSLNEGIGKISFKDIKIVYNKKGSPHILYKNQKYNISISHDNDFAIAVVLSDNMDYKFEIPKEFIKYFKPRDKNSHKGTYGRVGIIGGSIGMCGSVYMSALSSLKMGSGLVYNIVPKSISDIMQIKSMENIIIPIDDVDGRFSSKSVPIILEKINKYNAIAIGPGMSDFKDSDIFMENLITKVNMPIVIDADGINAISKNPEILNKLTEKHSAILTPHPMEMSRLSGYSVKEIQENREKIALEVSKKYNVILVLKGHNTIVTDGHGIYINNTGNPGMATAGSGDVLTGIILSLLGQGIEGFDAAKLGVYIHGLSGDIASFEIGEDGLMAGDIIRYIPKAIKNIKGNVKWTNINPI